eukprot:CAMPEP_0170614532 /NCGR_PEP_ID=MMETSP0224-20130122/24857_1 /TAXON_ID=285029 /ORGANISM="Togula jolla, Strain CCCM 725" /LENGTH=633 /DNA_ID=CAMNT_0010940209 /DNA_START=112 /DNA_END=2013 /DNA_ORIENTATION=+
MSLLSLLALPGHARLAVSGVEPLDEPARRHPEHHRDLTDGDLQPESWSRGHNASISLMEQSPVVAPRRILVTCLQSSGCSLFTLLLGQHARTATFVDVFISTPTQNFPRPQDLDPQDAEYIVLKTTIQGDDVVDPLARLKAIKLRFQPDKTILMVRDPADNYQHLLEHMRGDMVDTVCVPGVVAQFGYGARCGSPDGKLRALEMLYQAREDVFDAVVSHRDLVDEQGGWDEVIWTLNTIGFPLDREHFDMKRSTDEIETYARSCMGVADFSWGMGDAQSGEIQAQEMETVISEDLARAEALCPTLMSQWDDFVSHPVRAQSPLNEESLQWFGSRADESGNLILIFANSDYAEMLLNWLVMGKATQSVAQNYAIVCLDDVVESLLISHGEKCFSTRPRFYRRLDGSLSALSPLWMMRIRVLADLVGSDINVIMTDADALWLQDPMPILNQVAADGADVILSRGRSPMQEFKTWGATACMGFAVFRATEGTKLLLEEMLLRSKATMNFDDQELLNHVLLHAGLQFANPLQLQGSQEVDVGVIGPGFLKPSFFGTLSVAMLPHETFMRICDGDSDVKGAVVAHCVSLDKMASNGAIKRSELASRGLWVLSERWGTSTITKDFSGWIESLVGDKLNI